MKDSLMLIVKKNILDSWLKASFRNYSWLAEKMNFHKTYISQVVNNRCKVSMPCVAALLRTTHIPFDELFADDGAVDTREFYGDVYVVNGKGMRLPAYKKHLNGIEQGQSKESC